MDKPIPNSYAWLVGVKRKSHMLLEGLIHHGIAEWPGEDHNPVILSWAKEAAEAGAGDWLESFYQTDEIPWCGLFVAMLAARSGFSVQPDCLAARGWLDWGESVETPGLGDVLVFWRGSREGRKGHVGLYIAEDAEYYHVLGGNQGNQVSIKRLDKDRFLEARRGPGLPQAPVINLQDGAEISHNEA